jgi:short-subunit dehydrogenase
MLPQTEARADAAACARQILVNLTSVVVLGEALLPRLQPRGTLAVISSVAGDRGRQSNYLYGCTKAGLTAWLQGLRNRAFHEGKHVLTIKPGIVATPMTRGLVKEGSLLVALPETLARDILRAIDRHSNVVYSPWFWRPIMALIRSIPEPLFKRLHL